MKACSTQNCVWTPNIFYSNSGNAVVAMLLYSRQIDKLLQFTLLKKGTRSCHAQHWPTSAKSNILSLAFSGNAA
jgi:hypothetical protein